MNRSTIHTFAAAVMLTLIGCNATYAQNTLKGNEGVSFGGAIGKGLLTVSDDGTTLTFVLTRGPGGLNDGLVIYIDSKEGGFETTETFDDTDDASRMIISGFDGSHRSVVKFAAGFEADYAIAVDANYAGLFMLSKSGAHMWVESGNIAPKGDANASKFTFTFHRADLDAASKPIKICTSYVNPKDGYRSDEALGNVLNGSPVDDNHNFGYNVVEATSVTLKSSK